MNIGGMRTNIGVWLHSYFSLFINVKNEGEVSVKGMYMQTKFGYTTLYEIVPPPKKEYLKR